MTMSFWVIYDVSQLADYYTDVHNLIALPPGATIRYDYRRKYLTDSAIQLAETGATQPTPVLLIYEQKDCIYDRTQTESKPTDLHAACKRVATRLGTVLNVVSEGDRYFFDIQVEKYPSQNAASLDGILVNLGDSHPWSAEKNGFAAGKFVCLSDAADSYDRLAAGDEQQKWASVVNALSIAPMQFAGDVFWRLSGPHKGTGESRRPPDIVMPVESGRVRRADALYTMPRGSTWRFELISDVGRQVVGRPQYETEITTSDDTAVRLVGGSRFPLRRYTSQIVQFRAESTEKFGARTADLSFATVPKPGSWPSGPAFKLSFKTRENLIRLSLGILLAVVGTSAVVFGSSEFMKDHKGLAVTLQVAGTLIDLLAGALLIRKVSLPGG